jgi:hypothetical protein
VAPISLSEKQNDGGATGILAGENKTTGGGADIPVGVTKL